ncbi:MULTISPECIES: holin [Delftia]|uniref:holin n=1 Tax=Delftia TaxID=80865 RepID=UPI00062D44D2|nr:MULTISPECIES: holin [Delftia]MCX7508121.1 holin [Delftia tsuruhatensis]MDC2861054.1 holin [Delftia sp. DT-2]
MKTETLDTLATAGSRTTGGGAVVGFLGWLASSQAIGLLGICIALLGTLVNWYYRREADRRSEAKARDEAAERALRMELMRKTGIPFRPACEEPEQSTTDMGAL